MRLGKPSLLLNNHAFHHMLLSGIEVEYKAQDGRTVSGRAYLVDFENIENNDWLAVNQFTVEASHQNGKFNRRPDVVIFINGLPLAVIEFKNAADENATIWSQQQNNLIQKLMFCLDTVKSNGIIFAIWRIKELPLQISFSLSLLACLASLLSRESARSLIRCS